MDIVFGIFHITPLISNSTYIPAINEWMTGIEPLYRVCIGIGIACTIISIILSAVHLYYVFFYISSEEIQTDLYWLVFMSPIISLCGTVGMLIPRSATFLYAVALVYFMLCIFITVTIMTTLHGSRKAMCDKFLSRGRKINPRIFPLGCCLVCLPDIEPNEMNVRQIEWLVFQSPLLRIFLEILNIVVFMEINTRNHIWFQVTNVLGIISLFIGSYGSYMVVSLGSELLKAYRFSLMFYMVDTTQLIYSLQKLVLDFFNGVKFFGHDSVLSSSAKSQFWMSFLLTIEMLVISFMTSYFFRPSKTAFFDKYESSPVGNVAPKKFSPIPPTPTRSINLGDVQISTEQTDVESFKSEPGLRKRRSSASSEDGESENDTRTTSSQASNNRKTIVAEVYEEDPMGRTTEKL